MLGDYSASFHNQNVAAHKNHMKTWKRIYKMAETWEVFIRKKKKKVLFE